jgi:hypothetical protein
MFAILLAGGLVWGGACRADMAIAIGTTGNVYKDGFVWGGGFGEDARQTALDVCRGVKAPEVGKLPDNVSRVKRLCKIVTEFKDQCFAIAHDGSTTKPANGFGWTVADDLRSAEAEAIAKCESAVGRARSAACKVEYSRCDGAAEK